MMDHEDKEADDGITIPPLHRVTFHDMNRTDLHATVCAEIELSNLTEHKKDMPHAFQDRCLTLSPALSPAHYQHETKGF